MYHAPGISCNGNIKSNAVLSTHESRHQRSELATAASNKVHQNTADNDEAPARRQGKAPIRPKREYYKPHESIDRRTRNVSIPLPTNTHRYQSCNDNKFNTNCNDKTRVRQKGAPSLINRSPYRIPFINSDNNTFSKHVEYVSTRTIPSLAFQFCNAQPLRLLLGR